MINTTKKTDNPSPQYHLEKPRVSEEGKEAGLEAINEKYQEIREILGQSNEPTYLFWDTLKHKFKNNTVGIDSDQLWYVIRQLRNMTANPTSLRAEDKSFFQWLRLPSVDEILHKIDMFSGGRLTKNQNIISADKRQTYLNRGIIEEAIASSQLEGAHTTRKAAKKMIVENKQPKNESDQMILNNYKVMNMLQDTFKDRELSKDMLFELHSNLTNNTVPKDEQGRFRCDDDEIVVHGQIDNDFYITHVPPKQDFLNTEMNRLIAFANDDLDSKFMHPIIKAIFLHFWVGYLHPFTDGNGRLARSLFYWYLLKKGYWSFMYVPISTIIKKAPIQYSRAYIYSEQDNHDLTYFFDFHIKKIVQAIEEFEGYIDEKVSENKIIENKLNNKMYLNERQKQLLHFLISDDSASISVSSHKAFHNISRQTATKDLKDLESAGLLGSQRNGKFIKYFPTALILEK